MRALVLVFLCHSVLASDAWDADPIVEIKKVIDCDQFEKKCIVDAELKCQMRSYPPAYDESFFSAINIEGVSKKLNKGDTIQIVYQKTCGTGGFCTAKDWRSQTYFTKYQKCTSTQIEEQLKVNEILKSMTLLLNLKFDKDKNETIQKIDKGEADQAMKAVLDLEKDNESSIGELAVIYLYLGPDKNIRKKVISKINIFANQLSKKKEFDEKYEAYLFYIQLENYEKKYADFFKKHNKEFFLENMKLKNKFEKDFGTVIKKYRG